MTSETGADAEAQTETTSSFNLLLEREIPKLRRYAHALARGGIRADDLVQDCFVRALEKQHLFRRGSNLRAWLFTILHNTSVNQVRRAVREGTVVDVEEAVAAPALVQSARQGDRVKLHDLHRALGRLPEEQRQVLLLVSLEGLPYDRAAEVLDVPTGTVRSRLSRARAALRRLMDGGDARPKAAAAVVAA
jgi:RNA polymerase sigma-70 factor (ECF subfamily)